MVCSTEEMPMLHQFLLANEKEILAMTEKKSMALAGVRPNSAQLKKGLPIFYKQLMAVLVLNQRLALNPPAVENDEKMEKAAAQNDESAMATASGHPDDASLAVSAGIHGTELQRLGYTLSHVVHAYGAMCQSITELAVKKNAIITSDEFHELNRCLDVAIAGAVTQYQAVQKDQESLREVEHLGFLAHELRNALSTVSMAIELIKEGTVGFRGSTGLVLDRGLKRIEDLIDRSLTEVRLRADPKIHVESIQLLHIVNQIAITAEIEARSKNQSLEIHIDPTLNAVGDQQLIYSAISNLIQNALKYTHEGGKIQVRGIAVGENMVLEIEDECGGLSDKAVDLFKPFEQQNKDRTGLGLGLTIAQRAMVLNNGTLEVTNLPSKGCIFKITLPAKR
jgi:signal transduction histidine kinase